jgi:hypothetical protein
VFVLLSYYTAIRFGWCNRGYFDIVYLVVYRSFESFTLKLST